MAVIRITIFDVDDDKVGMRVESDPAMPEEAADATFAQKTAVLLIGGLHDMLDGAGVPMQHDPNMGKGQEN